MILSSHAGRAAVDDNARHSLLDVDLVRRDQIWFVEKGEDQASKLYPLSDFSPRKNEALEGAYLKGRYGAVPFLSRPDLHLAS